MYPWLWKIALWIRLFGKLSGWFVSENGLQRSEKAICKHVSLILIGSPIRMESLQAALYLQRPNGEFHENRPV